MLLLLEFAMTINNCFMAIMSSLDICKNEIVCFYLNIFILLSLFLSIFFSCNNFFFIYLSSIFFFV